MLRKLTLAATVMAAIGIGSISSAEARGGLGHFGGHAMMGPGFHHMAFRDHDHPFFRHAGFFRDRDDRFFRHRFFRDRDDRFFRDRDDRFFRHRFFRDRDDRVFFRHRFFRTNIAFYGGDGSPYGDDCLTRVWTRLGWRLVSVCY